MGSIRVFDLNNYISKYKCETYIETGTGVCDCFSHAIKHPFKEYYSIDIDGDLISNAKQMYNDKNIHFIHNYSHIALEDILANIPKDQSIFFSLDAHFPGADFHKITYEESITQFKEDAFPLIKEIDIIKKYRNIEKDVFIIDDWFLYEPQLDYQAHNTKNWPYRELQDQLGLVKNEDQKYITNQFENTHDLTVDLRDQGYLIITPKK